ncbi:hypothetical protein SOV_24790 [Sporomusa ovata DSM 2662]|nr:hypothetical protein SOV_4c04580 [Sporomusa ovata DSM 2662]
MQDYSPYTCDPIDICNSIKIQRVQPNLYLDMNQANIACSRTALCLRDNHYSRIVKTCNQAGKRV